ncbi:hypothetical protein OESDEN_03079 [Oesophagostomum dentatum]|uniref:DNA2/NAM7 helicase-like C-terminal domain-containing protein n=1 Tax=Oesophagostomum dentatum TaxID=61180 RepID=A0A0B1TI56_OESDE|nr:hypothetical protein OESDEN_03079 [Oesophagostomum dentatum]
MSYAAAKKVDGLPFRDDLFSQRKNFPEQSKLISGTAPNERRLLLDAIKLSNPDVPILFVDVAGESIRSTTGSHFNEAELQACRDLVQGLLVKGLPSASLLVIAFYREQYRKLEDYAQRLNIAIYTVESVQGRETDIVILLTTWTDIQLNQSDFIDDRLRMNVALTRSKHGLFVLGRRRSIKGRRAARGQQAASMPTASLGPPYLPLLF